MAIEQQSCVIDCWNAIGVRGDRSCPELKIHDHCQNCPVYAIAGRSLLDRMQPIDYIQDSTSILERSKKPSVQKQNSVVIFRLGHEKLALNTQAFHQIYEAPPIRKIPHMRSPVMLGLVNISGELQLCVSLAHLLELDQKMNQPFQSGKSVYARIAMIVDHEERWVFPSDEIYGVYRFANSQIKSPPSTVSNSSKPYTKGLFEYEGAHVGLLDEEKLFDALKRNVY